MKNITNAYVKRGAILLCKSGPTAGHYYMLGRCCSGNDAVIPFMMPDGPKIQVGNRKYSFNLFNLTDKGAARRTDKPLFITTLDGVDNPIRLSLIEDHFNLVLEDVTDMASVKVEMKDMLDEKLEEKRENEVLSQLGTSFIQQISKMLPVMGSAKVVPLFAADGCSVLAYVVQA